jgi:aspartate-semialdehyde dehydrogenase
MKAGIVGATSIVGQQFVAALKGHPWIKISALAACEKSAGRSYKRYKRCPVPSLALVLSGTSSGGGYGYARPECY